jgi:hypothetical protein
MHKPTISMQLLRRASGAGRVGWRGVIKLISDNNPPALHAARVHRQGGGSGAWQLHGCATGTDVKLKGD